MDNLQVDSESKDAALRVAQLLGCSGAHKTDSGWSPCESAPALDAILKGDTDLYKKIKLKEGALHRRGIRVRTIIDGDLNEQRKKRPRKRVRRKKRWEKLGERGIASIQGGGPGLTSGKAATGGGVIAVLLPDPESASRFLREGGLPMEELHVTMGYFNKPEDLPPSLKEELVVWAYNMAQKYGPVVANVAGVAEIGKDDPRAVALLIENPDFQKVRDELDQGEPGEHLDRTHPGFIPHMTLGYGISTEFKAEGKLLFNQVGVWWGSERLALPLMPQNEASSIE